VCSVRLPGRRWAQGPRAEAIRWRIDLEDGDVAEESDTISNHGTNENLSGVSDAIINGLPGAFYVYDCDRYLVRWNKNFETVSGYSPAELRGKYILDFFEGEDKDIINGAVERVIAKGAVEVEAAVLTKAGNKIPFYLNGVLVVLDGKPHVVGLGIDITERRRSEAALRKSEARSRAIAELLPEIVFETDALGNLVYLNQAGFEKSGYSPSDLEEGLHILQMVPAGQRAEALDDLGDALSGKPWVGGEHAARRKDGTTFPTSVYSAPVIQDGKTVGVMGIVMDVTQRVFAEKNLSARADRIMRFHKCLLSLSRADLADTVAHTRQITEADARALELERVSVWFFDDGGTAIVCEDLYEQSEGVHKAGLKIKASDYPRYFAALRASRTIAAGDACNDPSTSEFAEAYLRPLGITSMLDAAVWLHGKIIGVVCHEHVGPMRTWLPEEEDFAASIADMISLAVEASERRRAEEALGRSEEAFRQLVENVPIGIYRSTPEGRMLMANPTMVHMLGYSSFAELADRDLDAESNHHGYARRAYKEKIEQEGRIVGLESVWARSDGSLIHVRENARAIFDETGKAIYYEGTIEDITEQKWAEGALRQEAEFRRATIERACEGLCVCQEIPEHPFVRFTVWNERMTEITGYTMEEINARGWYQSVYPGAEAQARAVERMARMRLGDDLVGEEWEIVRADGARRIVSMSTSVLSVNDQDVHVLALMQDITERKRAEAELRQYQEHLKDLVQARTGELEEANRQLHDEIREREQLESDLIKAREAAESANRAKSAFLANMSHGIRTPMNAILGYAQILERDPGIGAARREYVEVINRSGEHLLGLINDILEMSKIEAGRATLNAEHFDFLAVMGDIEAMFRVRCNEKGLGLCFASEGVIPQHLCGDGGKIRDVLINLLGNAVKFTDSGGITVRTRALAGDGKPCAYSIAIDVEDTGCGIASDEIAAAFLPFEQTKSGRFQGSGTGLGLPISREYARMMGGDLTVESVVGRGSKFRFTFRSAAVDPSVLRSEQAGVVRQVIGLVPNRPAPKVLVVDDDDASREALSLHLEILGFDVRSVSSGAEAVAAVEQWQPDVALMDLWMPEVSGLEATRRIKALPGGGRTPVLAVTASVLAESEREAREAGADGFIRKPFRKAEVFGEIARVLGIEYLYEEQHPSAACSTAMLTDDTVDLPRELVAQITEAAEAGDGAKLRNLLDQNRDLLNAELRDALPNLANNYDYRRIVEIVSKAGTTGD
jgi:PAS domain S-box-containing protein